MRIKLKEDKKYSFCSCGLSNSLPFCDNMHRNYNAENGTKYKSVKIRCEKETFVQVHSNNWPLDSEIK